MARPRLRAGEIGRIRVVPLPSGLFQASALMRDEVGDSHRLKVSRATEAEARLALEERAAAIRFDGVGHVLDARSTVADAAAVFLATKRGSQLVEVSTVETYEHSVKHVVIPACGELLLVDLTVARCNRILQRIRETKSLSAARKARSMLSQICATATEHGVLTINPVRDARRPPLPPKKTSVLTSEQVGRVRDLIRDWRADGRHHGPRPNAALLEDAMWIMLGTSARIGEVLALRRCDVDVTTLPPTLLVDATMRQTRSAGLERKPAPKRARQTRRIALPSFAAAAIRRRLAIAERHAEASLFMTRTGKSISTSNYERLLRSFVDDSQDALRAAGINVEQFTTHIFRRTAATTVEAAAGITLASRLLGHANEQVTRASYVVSAEMVDPLTAQIIDDAFDGYL